MMKNELIKQLESAILTRPNATKFRRTSKHDQQVEASPHTVAMQIKATSGLGKTRTAIEAVASHSLWSKSEIHFHTPDHEHSDEIAKIASELGLRVKVISGRNRKGFCNRRKITDQAAKSGLNVYRSCC